MSNLSLRLPDSLHRKLREIAEKDDVSINQFIATAVAEKTAALLTVEYLEKRGRRADPQLMDRLLSRVAEVEPAAGDRLAVPSRSSQNSRTGNGRGRRKGRG